jgi:hypothetical protein
MSFLASQPLPTRFLALSAHAAFALLLLVAAVVGLFPQPRAMEPGAWGWLLAFCGVMARWPTSSDGGAVSSTTSRCACTATRPVESGRIWRTLYVTTFWLDTLMVKLARWTNRHA